MTRFMRNLNGEFGAYWKKNAEEEIAKNRWSIWGKRLHDNNIRKGHKKAADNMAAIREKSPQYAAYDRAVELPEPVK